MRLYAAPGCPYAPRCAQYVPKFGSLLLVVPRPRGFLDAALGFVLLAGDALGVDTQEYVDAVTRPVGDLRGGHSGVQPCGNRGVPQVTGAPGEQARCFLAAEGRGASLVEDLEVGPVIEDPPRGRRGDRARGPVAPPGPAERIARLSPAKVLGRISRARLQRDELDAELALLIDHAASLRIGWPDIARCLGVSRQAARQHYQRRHRDGASCADQVA